MYPIIAGRQGRRRLGRCSSGFHPLPGPSTPSIMAQFRSPCVNSVPATLIRVTLRYSTTLRYRIAPFSPRSLFTKRKTPTKEHLGRSEKLRAAPPRHAGRRESHSPRLPSGDFFHDFFRFRLQAIQTPLFYSRRTSGFIAPRPPGASTFACIADFCARRAHSSTTPSSCTPSNTLLARGSFGERGGGGNEAWKWGTRTQAKTSWIEMV